MRFVATAGVVLLATLTLSAGHARAQSCEDDGDKLLSAFGTAKDALAAKGCSESDGFLSARSQFADFLDDAPGRGCSDLYVRLNRLIVSMTYKKPPAECDWQAKADNRQLQHDAIAAINRDLAGGVFLDGAAVVTKQEFWHEGNHTLGLALVSCSKEGADAAFAMRCAESSEPSETKSYVFDVRDIDTEHMNVEQKSALAVFTSNSAATPEDLVKALTRRGSISDAMRIVLSCLPDKRCVRIADGVSLNLVQLYCDSETSCNDVLEHLIDVQVMMRRPPH